MLDLIIKLRGEIKVYMEQKRVLYLENCIGYGGAAICMKLLAANINREKYYPIVVTSQNNQDYQKISEFADWYYIRDKFVDRDILKKRLWYFFSKLSIKGKFVEVLNSLADYILNFFPYLIRLLLFVKRKKVDLIHLNNDPLSNMAGVIVSRLLRIPCICHVRDPMTWDSKTIRRLYGSVDFIITVAEWLRGRVIKLGISENMVQTINDGRVLDEFIKPFDDEKIRKSIGLSESQLSLGIIGLLIPWKGHKVFVDAAQIVENRFPECKIFIVGGAPDNCKEYEEELKKMVVDKGIKNLVFTGHKDNIPKIMRVLDIIVHTSILPDPYPNVVIEAMASGKPIVATNIGGPLEMIENNKTGFLVAPNNPSILAEKICELINNRDLRLSMGEEAKKVAFKRNSIEAHVRKVEDVYEMIMNK